MSTKLKTLGGQGGSGKQIHFYFGNRNYKTIRNKMDQWGSNLPLIFAQNFATSPDLLRWYQFTIELLTTCQATFSPDDFSHCQWAIVSIKWVLLDKLHPLLIHSGFSTRRSPLTPTHEQRISAPSWTAKTLAITDVRTMGCQHKQHFR